MKQLACLLVCSLVLYSCKRESPFFKNSSSLCFEHVYINTGIPDVFTSVFFLTGKDGFVTGSRGGIYKTTDSANTWTSQNSTTNLPLYDIYFLDANNGFAVGGENSCTGTGCVPPGGLILKTSDGGKNWSRVYTTLTKKEITSICFINHTVGFCIGDQVIYKTVDGGAHWTEQDINIQSTLKKMQFSDSQNGFIVCLYDKILKTTDGGSSWHVTSPGKTYGYYDLSLVEGVSYVSGQSKVLRSTDNGNSWNELANSPQDIFAIHFVNKNTGYAFGRGVYSGGDFGFSYGAMYCTNNGGVSWNGRDDFKEVGLIGDVSFPSAKIGYAVSPNKVIRIVIP